MTIRIYIARDFSKYPGARYKKYGPASGEEFRERFLEPLFDSGDDEPIEIIMDEAAGYPPGFLEEAFGGLVRLKQYSPETIKQRLKFIAHDPVYQVYTEEAQRYINAAICRI